MYIRNKTGPNSQYYYQTLILSINTVVFIVCQIDSNLIN